MKNFLLHLCALVILVANSAASTFTVNQNGDPGDGVCDGAGCTLREAINAANAHPGADTIAFNIPGAGLQTITLTGFFPVITDPVTIDGYTQPGASLNTKLVGDNAVLLLEVNGDGSFDAFVIEADDCTIQGLVINRCTTDGIRLQNSDRCAIKGNFIGTNAAGTVALGNSGDGISIEPGSSNVIGGTTPGARNVISGNASAGILLARGGATPSADNVIQGNYIGTNAAGTIALENVGDGMDVFSAERTIVGGSSPGAGNLISGNVGTGISLSYNVDSTLQGNLIGTDATGIAGLGNSRFGIADSGSIGNVIGGTNSGAGNVISANGEDGVHIAFGQGSRIEGNLIGTDRSASVNLGNKGNGVFLAGSDHILGGTIPGTGNTIAFNVGAGVAVFNLPFGGSRMHIVGNSIFHNSSLGIDLIGGAEDSNHVTANDETDADSGSNNLQNYPLISQIVVTGSERTVLGSLTSVPNTNYTLDFYANSEVDPSGYGEGETWLGSLEVQTDPQGTADFLFTYDASRFGQFVTTTATDPDGNTSEFSRASDFVPPLSRFLNISTRLRVQTGDSVLIGGFIITGNDPKKVIVRAIGPSLGGKDLLAPLADPVLELHKPDGTVITNNNWRDFQEDAIIASGVPPTNELESAIVRTLDPGSYTAIVRGKNGSTGVGLVEAYDLDPLADSELANISTRGFVETGDNVLIGGIIVGPEDAADGSILIRALGPSLTALGVPDALVDPTLELHNGEGDLIAANDNWKSTQKTAIEKTGIPPTEDKESALIATLPSGNYTVIVRGANETIGIGLVEVYHLEEE